MRPCMLTCWHACMCMPAYNMSICSSCVCTYTRTCVPLESYMPVRMYVRMHLCIHARMDGRICMSVRVSGHVRSGVRSGQVRSGVSHCIVLYWRLTCVYRIQVYCIVLFRSVLCRTVLVYCNACMHACMNACMRACMHVCTYE